MPTSTTEWRLRRGFTLIELLVVLVLIGLSLGVVLAVGLLDNEQDAEDQLRLFASALQQASAQAVLDGEAVGIDLALDSDAQGQLLQWRLLQLQDERWTPADVTEQGPPSGSTAAQLRGDRLQLSVAGQPYQPAGAFAVRTGEDAEDIPPDLVFWPTREATALQLVVTTAGQAEAVLAVDMLGRIRVNDDAPPPPL